MLGDGSHITLMAMQMIELDKNLLIGKGWHRECYQHPENPNLCIKVVVNGSPKESLRELAYYKQLTKRNISWSLLPRYLGNVKTVLGEGAVFEIIRDHDDEISQSLTAFLEDPQLLSENHEAVSAALIRLREYMLSQRIISMTIKPKNILLQRVGEQEFNAYVIDNIGNAEFFPVSSYIPICAKKKILRRWKRFKTLLVKDYANNPSFKQLEQRI